MLFAHRSIGRLIGFEPHLVFAAPHRRRAPVRRGEDETLNLIREDCRQGKTGVTETKRRLIEAYARAKS